MTQIDGTALICPECGDRVELTITSGASERRGDSVVVAVGFDHDEFTRRFEEHVLSDPLMHSQFIDRTARDTP